MVPFAIFYLYYIQYDPKLQATPRINTYMDTWTINTTASCSSSSSHRGSTFSRRWRQVVVFVPERNSGIQEVPPSLLFPAANTWVLSLAGNAIRVLPEDFFTIRKHYHLFLDRNLIHTLPESPGW